MRKQPPSLQQRSFLRHAKWFFPLLLPLAFLSLRQGCGDNPQITGASVEGVVKYRGSVLTGGTIRLVSVSDDNKSTTGLINPDGSYVVENAPLGEVKVVVDTELAKIDMVALHKLGGSDVDPTKLGPPMKYMKIDEQLSNPDKTPLRLTLRKGHQELDVNIP